MKKFFHCYLMIICYGICVSKRHADSVSISADLIIFYSHTFHRIYLFVGSTAPSFSYYSLKLFIPLQIHAIPPMLVVLARLM